MENEMPFTKDKFEDFVIKTSNLNLKTFYIKCTHKIFELCITVNDDKNTDVFIDIEDYFSHKDDDFDDFDYDMTDDKYYVYKFSFNNYLKLNIITIASDAIDYDDVNPSIYFVYDTDDIKLIDEVTSNEVKQITFQKKYYNMIKFYHVINDKNIELNKNDYDIKPYKKNYYKLILLNDDIDITNIVGKRLCLQNRKGKELTKQFNYRPYYDCNIKIL
jgi:hypothetical protein